MTTPLDEALRALRNCLRVIDYEGALDADPQRVAIEAHAVLARADAQKDEAQWVMDAASMLREMVGEATEVWPSKELCKAWLKEVAPMLARVPESFQIRLRAWMLQCFGPDISRDKIERNHRFLEEALELVQALGCTASEAHQLVDYTFGRPVGDPKQEAGGVKVTLAALCDANDMDLDECGETELARVWTKIDVIRAKQAAKPKHSPLAAAKEDSHER